ncbi:porin [Iodobacter arcticus]|uniref:Porin n=1 Tax=Iodobacter arcticus TaxID=590593 RepID=A0ABW2R143_9NEIS
MTFKKILATAIASLCVVSYAQADVTLYGIAQKSIDYGNDAADNKKFSMQDIGSRVGFKGLDKLDNGSNLLWKLETGLDKGFGSREAWIGYENKDAGTLRFGKSKGAYDLLVETFDLFESNTTLANTFQDVTYNTRHDNAIYYTSPNWGGFTANVNAVIDSTAGISSSQKGYDATVNYTHSKFAIYAGTASLKNMARKSLTGGAVVKSDSKVTSYLLGAKVFPVEGLQIGALYQNTKQDAAFAGGEFKRDSAIIMAQYEVGKWVPRVGYVYQGEGKQGNKKVLAKANHFQIGTDYNLSKSSLLYVEGAVIQNKDQNAFSTSISEGLASTPKVVSAGMILLF